MASSSFGISDIAYYVPAPTLRVGDLRRHREGQGDDIARFDRARDYTGQEEMRIPDWYEDTVTMVAEATRKLLARNPRVGLDTIRHYSCGTETPQDYAKPVSSYCQGLVQVEGMNIGPNVAISEVKHACAAGTYALLNVLAGMSIEARRGLPCTGIVTMGDVARYRGGSSAELTQGAGSVALLLERNPRLLAIEPAVVGTYSHSVDDFFRSLGDSCASVKGRYSIDCYREALLGAYEDYKDRALASGHQTRPAGGHFLDGVDYAVFHAPFQSMPLKAMEELLSQRRGMSAAQAAAEAQRLGVHAGLKTVARTGNLYTASLYFCLGGLLVEEFERLGDSIEGKRILLFSYGSGNTMLVFSATVMPGAGRVIERLGLWDSIESDRRLLSAKQYQELMSLDRSDRAAYNAVADQSLPDLPDGRYALAWIREDGYRVYGEAGRESA